jgi:hypothetical protein
VELFVQPTPLAPAPEFRRLSVLELAVLTL